VTHAGIGPSEAAPTSLERLAGAAVVFPGFHGVVVVGFMPYRAMGQRDT
jgi:hypothetical protein